MKFVVSFGKTEQMTEDTWAVHLQTLIADENTTLGQIREWYKKRNFPFTEPKEDWRMDEVKVCESDVI